MKESIPSCFALIFPMVMKQVEAICTFHLEIMCTTSLQTILVCCISNFVFFFFLLEAIYIYIYIYMGWIQVTLGVTLSNVTPLNIF